MSISYKVIAGLVRALRIKKIFLLPKDKILNYARKQNQKPSFKLKDEADIYYEIGLFCPKD